MLVAIEITKSPISIYWALIISAQDRVIRRPLPVALCLLPSVAPNTH